MQPLLPLSSYYTLASLTLTVPSTARNGTGALIERWFNIPGTTLDDLFADARFPNQPDARYRLSGDKLSTPFNIGSFFGQRIT